MPRSKDVWEVLSTGAHHPRFTDEPVDDAAPRPVPRSRVVLRLRGKLPD